VKCLNCTELLRTLISADGKYERARSSPFYNVSTELDAKEQVDMERDKSDLYEHQLVCSWFWSGCEGQIPELIYGNSFLGSR
jgi:hypothetical protein